MQMNLVKKYTPRTGPVQLQIAQDYEHHWICILPTSKWRITLWERDLFQVSLQYRNVRVEIDNASGKNVL